RSSPPRRAVPPAAMAPKPGRARRAPPAAPRARDVRPRPVAAPVHEIAYASRGVTIPNVKWSITGMVLNSPSNGSLCCGNVTEFRFLGQYGEAGAERILRT